MKKLAAVLLTTVSLSISSGALANDHSKPMTMAAAVLDQTIADGQLIFAVAAVGNTGGQTWSHAAGYQDAEKTNVASPDNIIQIASMTKLVTTIAALQLVEQGKLNLDSPISAYAPELNDLQVLKGFKADETPMFERAKRAPTARELMAHTAGYAYEIWNANALKGVQLGVTPSLLGEGNYLEAPLAFQPGTAWEYGINTDWLGVLVERLSGQRLANYFDDNIFTPLSMTDTFYELPADKLDRSVTMMARAAEGLVELPGFQPTPRERQYASLLRRWRSFLDSQRLRSGSSNVAEGWVARWKNAAQSRNGRHHVPEQYRRHPTTCACSSNAEPQ